MISVTEAFISSSIYSLLKKVVSSLSYSPKNNVMRDFPKRFTAKQHYVTQERDVILLSVKKFSDNCDDTNILFVHSYFLLMLFNTLLFEDS